MSGLSLRVNPILCDAHGLCAEVFPERIELDEWGEPSGDAAPSPPSLEAHARRAVDVGRVLALPLERRDAARTAKES